MRKVLIAAIAGLAAPAIAQVVIVSFQGNGILTWTDPGFESNSLHRIEWAPAVTGPWAGDWSGLRLLEMTNITGSSAVPMFYRVVRETNQTTIAGSWGLGRPSLMTFEVLTFYTNGLYVHWTTNSPDAPGLQGAEFGLYSYTASNHSLSVQSLRDDNGNAGLTTAIYQLRQLSAYVMGDTLILKRPGSGSQQLARVKDSSNPIVGGWGTLASGTDWGVVTLYANGYWINWETAGDGDPEGVEYGTYTYNPVTKDFITRPIVDANGHKGLANPNFSIGNGAYRWSVTFSNNNNTMLVSGYPLQRVQ
jgi:hypothetical protein